MAAFKTLRIQNFQCHSKLQIDLDPHVTTIIGSSDAGKSAIIRALKWLCTNRPGGEAFIRDGESTASVGLIVDDHKIIRKRGRSKNLYRVDSQTFKAFGSEVPVPVADLLNLSSLNFQDQHDAPFWFGETPGQVSRELNRIVDLGTIDRAMTNIASKLRSEQATASVIGERLEQATAEEKRLAWVEKVDESLSRVEDLEKQHRSVVSRKALVARLLEESVTHASLRDRAAGVLRVVSVAVQQGSRAIHLRNRIKSLGNWMELVLHQQSILERGAPDITRLRGAAQSYVTIHQEVSDLSTFLEELEDFETKASEKSREYSRAEKQLTKEVGETCPICKRPMPMPNQK